MVQVNDCCEYLLCCLLLSAGWVSGENILVRNSIKKPESEGVASIQANTSRQLRQDDNSNKAADIQVCTADEDCGTKRYCSISHQRRQLCLTCKKQKKRCHRDQMCCPGNHCINGICAVELPISKTTRAISQPGAPEADSHSALPMWSKNDSSLHRAISAKRGLEGDSCLRSSDCAEGFCCSRHLWNKICKPLLLKDEVCTKLRRKGARGADIYERCDCAKGLVCRSLRHPGTTKKTRLSTCQTV
ncbi:dickkopf-related protein 2-like isoform X2 [Scyliorhinus canicula]|uniref:dickkopf-related protein 2-like isoform X2 n=1 Tax=Scyliorhinus canicula TaxID=7830 RepID=UPI0018F5F81D|nr:dickkopf-related protein 2-like isoform X2 [Scyliorhinus canicula]